jgi:hypothetical protein
MNDRVTLAEIRELAPVRRCAWGAICAEALTRLYSRHFEDVFDTEGAYSLVWRYISTGTADSPGVKRYMRQCSRKRNSDEAYRYSLPNGMLASLVAETIYPHGDSVIECIGFCARMYSNILFFRHNIDDRVAGFDSRHVYALIAGYNRFSRSVYDFLKHSEDNIRRDLLTAMFVLDATAFKPPQDLYLKTAQDSGAQRGHVPPEEVVTQDPGSLA